MTTQTKKSPGRPKQTQESPRKPKIRRVENSVSVPNHYKSVRSKAVLMLMQSGITVFDEESKRVREIRYCENEHSIFKDEQGDFSVKTPVIFKMGNLFVPSDKPNLQAYLEVHPDNKANMLRNKELDELLSVALAYGMDVNRATSEIKHDLLQKAKKSPKAFIESFDNPVVAMKSKIKQAVSYQIIKADSDAIKWFDTNKHIISVPVGQDPVDVFVRYCMTEAAAPVVGEIERQLG